MFEMCEWLISRQTYDGPLQWIVVDDGVIPTTCTKGQEYIRRSPNTERNITANTHTVGLNLREALDSICYDKVLVIEDDDYYHPTYLSKWYAFLDDYDLVGESGSKYYSLDTCAYQHFDTPVFHTFAALARTGFTSAILEIVKKACRGDSQVDRRIWDRRKKIKSFLMPPSISGYHISIKNGPGRRSHNYGRRLNGKDFNFKVLLDWTKGDWRAVSRYKVIKDRPKFLTSGNSQGIVYTITTHDAQGVAYSVPRRPQVKEKGVRYVCVTDRDDVKYAGWEILCPDVSELELSSEMLSRYWKLNPHKLFSDAKWVLYLDSSLNLKSTLSEVVRQAELIDKDCAFFVIDHPYGNSVGDELVEIVRRSLVQSSLISTQYSEYNKAGYLDLTVYQCGFILRDLSDERVNKLDHAWWNELTTYGHRRDQPSFPVAAKKAGVHFKSFSYAQRSRTFTKWSGHTRPRKVNYSYTRGDTSKGIELTDELRSQLNKAEVIVCEARKFIYLKPTKTGGSKLLQRILNPLFKDSLIHKKVTPEAYDKWLRGLTSDSLDSYFIFSTVRDPISRFKATAESFSIPPSELLQSASLSRKLYSYLSPQTDLTHHQGNSFCDFYIRWESFRDDVESLLDLLNMPRLKARYEDDLVSDLKELERDVLIDIYHMHKRDFELLEYKAPLDFSVECRCSSYCWCPKFNRLQSERDVEICQGVDCSDVVRNKYMNCWKPDSK